MPVFCISDQAVARKQELNTVCDLLKKTKATEESALWLAVKSY